jgi:aminoglycoside/choline kinase family phosphotransferase
MTPITDDTRREFDSFLNSVLEGAAYEVFQLAGDASARRYFRIVSGNESFVLMVWEPFRDDGNYPFLSVLNHFAKHGVAVPNVVSKAPDKGLVLLEDLGDLTLERKFWENQSQQSIIPFYRQAIDELIKMHYPSTFDRTDCTAFKMEFDVEKLMWELNYGREHVLTKLCNIKLSDVESRELDKVFTKICTLLHSEPKYIAHRDYHSRNVMLKHGKARIIDFQDARLGAVQYDLVSLLRDSYVNMEDAIARELISYYLDRRREIKAPRPLEDVSIEKFMQTYEVQTIQRCFKACGSFSSFYNLRSDTRYLKYLVPTLQTVKKSLWAFEDYRPFFNILEDHGVFDRKFEVA